jgi:3-isopropylmalate dehydrogenase
MSNDRTYQVAVLGGDGIGPEVTQAALEVISAAGVNLTTTPFDLGAARYLRDGFVLDDATLEELRRFDAILLGAIGPAIGDTRIPGGTLERGLLLRLRFGLDLYINYRPFHGVAGSLAQGCDFSIVRENTEGPYAGEGGVLRRGTRRTRSRPRDRSTPASASSGACATPSNGPPPLHRRRMPDPRAQDERAHVRRRPLVAASWPTSAAEFPSVAVDYNHVDAACIYLVESPQRYGVIVTDNLFGDILSDLAGAVTGGIGFAASANLNPARTGASLFEPVHGAAHDIAGTGTCQSVGRRVLGRLSCSSTSEEEDAATADRSRPCKTLMVTSPRSARDGVTDQSNRKAVDMPTDSHEEDLDGRCKLVAWENATTHVLSHTLHYGTGAFEGIRAYPRRLRMAWPIFRLARAHGPPAEAAARSC